jgi:paraquat-inducible protein A
MPEAGCLCTTLPFFMPDRDVCSMQGNAIPVQNDETAIPEAYPEQARQLRWFILVAAVLLLAGLAAPIITLKKFILVENTFSVLSGVIELLEKGQFFLFLLIAGFSVMLPILKLSVLYLLVSRREAMQPGIRKLLHWMHLYGKWSMLDVFVVAVLVVAVKLGVLVDVEMRYGLYAFAASVLLTMFITARVVSLSGPPGQR